MVYISKIKKFSQIRNVMLLPAMLLLEVSVIFLMAREERSGEEWSELY